MRNRADGFDIPSEKICGQCKALLPRAAFHSNVRRPDRLAYYCKTCASLRNEVSSRRRGIAAQRRPGAAVPAGQKWCPDCDTIKPSEEFPRSAGSRHTYCKPCHNARGKETAQRLYGGSRHHHLRRRYGIGTEEFAAMLALQGGVCAVCSAPDPKHVDHDHRTGAVRGILCFNCNGGLGQFRDRVPVLRSAIGYLERTTPQRASVAPGVTELRRVPRPRPSVGPTPNPDAVLRLFAHLRTAVRQG